MLNRHISVRTEENMAKRGSNIYKRKDGRFEGRVPVGYQDNGKIKYKSVYARTLSEVKEKMTEIHSIRQNQSVSAIKLTVREAAQQWLSSAKLRVKESSYVNYANIVNKHILPILGGEMMMNLTTSKINDFIHFKLTNGRLNGKGGLSAKSVRDIMTVYRSIETFAAREYGFRETYFTMPKSQSKQTSILTFDERKRLETYLIGNTDRTSMAVLLCLFTGLRVGELCGLKWEDIDFDNAVLYVKRTVQRISKNGKSQIVIGTPKSRTSVRTIPIPDFVLEKLKNYKNCNDFYIITGKNNPTEPRTMQNRFKSILKKCEIRDVNFHLLRHTYATVCIEKGFDPKSLSEILGHADASITLNRYCHPSMQIKKDYVSRLSLTA